MTSPVLFVGIDVSKLKHDIAIMNEDKKLVSKTFVIQDQYSGYVTLIDNLDHFSGKLQTKQLFIGLEATGDYWKNLYYFLKRQPKPFSVTVINPVRTRAFAKTELRRAKTDPVNAKDIALFMVEKRPSESTDRPPLFDTIKDIDKRIHKLKRQNTMNVNRLRIELTKVAPEIEKAVSRLQGRQILALLAEFPTAEAIKNASVKELAQIRYGKNNWALPIPFIHKMKALAENSIAYKNGNGAGSVVQSLIRSIIQTNQEISQLKEQSVELYKTFNKQDSLLSTIPCITKETAILLESYIGDINRFSNSKQFVAYFGMNPTVNQSGKSKRASYLQKKGEPVVRHKLFMAVIGMISKRIIPIYPYYRRLVDSGKPKLVAICAAMRKLLTIIYALLKNNERFDQNKC